MPAATLRRISMKALARYQVILLGEQLAQGCCPNNAAVGVEPATSWSRVQRSNHYTTQPPIEIQSKHNQNATLKPYTCERLACDFTVPAQWLVALDTVVNRSCLLTRSRSVAHRELYTRRWWPFRRLHSSVVHNERSSTVSERYDTTRYYTEYLTSGQLIRPQEIKI